jgi:hypothetical protein
MIVGELKRALGAGKKVFAEAVSVADGGTVDTGLSRIDAAVVCSTNPDHVAAITSISGGVITIGLHDNAGSAITSAETVYVIAIGDP